MKIMIIHLSESLPCQLVSCSKREFLSCISRQPVVIRKPCRHCHPYALKKVHTVIVTTYCKKHNVKSSSLFIVTTRHHPRSFESIPLNGNICFRAAHTLLPTEQTPIQLTDTFITGIVAIKMVKDTWN